jgi:hypothetical protein
MFVSSNMALNLVVIMASPEPFTTVTFLLGPTFVYILALVRPPSGPQDAFRAAASRGLSTTPRGSCVVPASLCALPREPGRYVPRRIVWTAHSPMR